MKKLIALLAVMLVLVACTTAKKNGTTNNGTKAEVVEKHEDIQPAETSTTEIVRPIAFNTVYFEYNKYRILPEEMEKLSANVEVLKNNPKAKVIIEGHCDERGSKEYNYRLGKKRAAEAKKYLVKLGINPKRIAKIKSYGKDKPAVTGNSETYWSKNRRAEFVIIK